ncbi:uncharacterized protein EURHEDRAFT_412315 [Aspergillus ruber CBS 135680]|uniref:Uncharacterized protein n=1 Tax=Aspergillus ruber (strain CBS 135680) TaxID=1388766 RepID=A0A017SEX0_ASPRC|nr:uncharacterized protein EURHEDRAFT_412315 [Aspergillus ruber CBS 135680]EYE95497.1 hypothetical protein EURHEDRAFT_412315 [Aspergillus ruber CBS 135680]
MVLLVQACRYYHNGKLDLQRTDPGLRWPIDSTGMTWLDRITCTYIVLIVSWIAGFTLCFSCLSYSIDPN